MIFVTICGAIVVTVASSLLYDWIVEEDYFRTTGDAETEDTEDRSADW
jgi:hypothetical protein